LANVLAGDAARHAIGRSLAAPLRAIAASLGPNGRACLYEGDGGSTAQAMTGAAIARMIADDEGPRSIAPRILKEVLFDAERELGDGTARLAVIMGATFATGLKFIAAGTSPGALADALLALTPRITAAIAAEKLQDYDAMRIAESAGIGGTIAVSLTEASLSVGTDGVLEIVTGTRPDIATRLGNGFIFDGVPIASVFAPAEPDGIAFDPVHILVADEMIDDFGPLVPILEGFATRGKALVVVARDVTGAALAALVQNHRNNGLRVAAMKPQDVAQQAADVLEDLALATGATLIADRFGTSVAGLRPTHLGRAASFRFRRNRAVFSEPAGDPAAVTTRARVLEAEAERNKYLSLDRERAERRRARLLGRWGEIELADVSDRDTQVLVTAARAALASLRSAETGGAVAGGGIALTRVAARLAAATERQALSVEDAALSCAIAGLMETSRRLEQNAGDAALPTRPGAAQKAAVPRSVPCPDPLHLTQSIVQRALSLAATFIRVDAFIST
jgi:chaperonin GroEL